jgi:uncharacterized membrane-anchored protein YhcB (DUF1043 family)
MELIIYVVLCLIGLICGVLLARFERHSYPSWRRVEQQIRGRETAARRYLQSRASEYYQRQAGV